LVVDVLNLRALAAKLAGPHNKEIKANPKTNFIPFYFMSPFRWEESCSPVQLYMKIKKKIKYDVFSNSYPSRFGN
jgi:hypothetical protein